MTFILSPERDEDPIGAFTRYRSFISEHGHRLPPGALALAKSDWYYGAEDHRAPHDSWLVGASFEEIGEGKRREKRVVALRLRLLGAYHDLEIEFFYPRVYSYSFVGGIVELGHGDWRYDEFRLSEDGRLIHEIQWCGLDDQATWLIEASDVEFSTKAVAAG